MLSERTNVPLPLIADDVDPLLCVEILMALPLLGLLRRELRDLLLSCWRDLPFVCMTLLLLLLLLL